MKIVFWEVSSVLIQWYDDSDGREPRKARIAVVVDYKLQENPNAESSGKKQAEILFGYERDRLPPFKLVKCNMREKDGKIQNAICVRARKYLTVTEDVLATWLFHAEIVR